MSLHGCQLAVQHYPLYDWFPNGSCYLTASQKRILLETLLELGLSPFFYSPCPFPSWQHHCIRFPRVQTKTMSEGQAQTQNRALLYF
eukprot:2982013-Amphidinium_carterae.1